MRANKYVSWRAGDISVCPTCLASVFRRQNYAQKYCKKYGGGKDKVIVYFNALFRTEIVNK